MRQALFFLFVAVALAWAGSAASAAPAAPLSVAAEPPAGAFPAASRHTFKFTLTVQRRLDVGSDVRVITPREGGWSKPSLAPAQEEAPGEFGLVAYGLVKAADPATRLEGKPERYSDRGPPYTDRDRVSQFVMHVEGAPLSVGDVIEASFPNARVSRLAAHRDPTRNVSGYRVQVKPRGSEEWQEIEGLPRYQILPVEPQRLVIRTTSRVVRDEAFAAAIHVQDQFQNPVPTFQGRVTLKSTDPAAVLPQQVFFRSENRGVLRVEGLRLRTPGVHTLTVTSGTDLPRGSALSTPIEVLAEKPALRLFWGEMHCHGALSYDARNWSGCTMRPDDMYGYARSIQNLDFAAVTDHSMHSTRLTQQNITEPEFREIQAAARANNRDGEFVTFSAVEQRCARGDTNAYLLRDDDDWYMKDGPITVQQMWDFYRRVELFTIPHLHPLNKNQTRFDAINPEKERLIEVHSNHGRYEYHNNEPLFPKKGMVEGNNVQDILSRGHRLGFVAASDDHSGRPGSADLTAVYAPELTREAIFRAIRARHTYGTTRARMALEFRLGDRLMMGDEARVGEGDPLWKSRRFSVRVLGTDNLKLVEIVRSGKVVYSTQPKGVEARFEYVDPEPLDQAWLGTEKNNPATAYYYLRVTQQPESARGEQQLGMGWTSPIYLYAAR